VSLILAILGVIFLLLAHFFSTLASDARLSEQGISVARAVHIPFLLIGLCCLVLAPLLLERSPLRRRLRAWLPRESQLIIPGLIGLGVMLVIFIMVKLGEYSRTLVSREQFWDNYLLFGSIPVRFPSEPFTVADYMNSTLLLVAGVTALLVRWAVIALRPPGAPPLAWRERIFWLLLGVGFIYLALDEIFQFHEFMGANGGFDDGKIIMGYLVLMGATCLVFLPKFLSIRVAFACLVVGAFFQGVGAISDRFHYFETGFTPEEVAEMSASGFYLLAILQYAYRDLLSLVGRNTAGSEGTEER
jgi:hypothetical protein